MPLHNALLALGSNIRAEENMPAAVRLLERWGQVTAVSRVFQSAPVGFTEQADFLNAAVMLQTEFSAAAVIGDVIPAIEKQLKRQRDPQNKNAPRTIDIDLVMYDEFVGEALGHYIPDPDILERPFLAIPLAEIAPEMRHPMTGETLRQIAARFLHEQPLLLERPDLNLSSVLTSR